MKTYWFSSYWYTKNYTIVMFAEKKRYYWKPWSEPTKFYLNKEIWFPSIYSKNSPKIFGRFCLWGWGMHDSSLSGPAMQTSRLTHWEIVWKITNYLITYDNPLSSVWIPLRSQPQTLLTFLAFLTFTLKSTFPFIDPFNSWSQLSHVNHINLWLFVLYYAYINVSDILLL